VGEIEDFKRRKALKHIGEIIERINLCMFCTRLGHVPFASRPMTTIKVDEECRIWFFSNEGSHKNEEINRDDRVELLYEDLNKSEFLAIHGTAEILVNGEKCRELWTPSAANWFPNGPEDPELTIILVTPIFCHHWFDKQYKLIAMLAKGQSKMVGSPDDVEEGVAVPLSS
jgi:general stress protein 26